MQYNKSISEFQNSIKDQNIQEVDLNLNNTQHKNQIKDQNNFSNEDIIEVQKSISMFDRYEQKEQNFQNHIDIYGSEYDGNFSEEVDYQNLLNQNIEKKEQLQLNQIQQNKKKQNKEDHYIVLYGSLDKEKMKKRLKSQNLTARNYLQKDIEQFSENQQFQTQRFKNQKANFGFKRKSQKKHRQFNYLNFQTEGDNFLEDEFYFKNNQDQNESKIFNARDSFVKYCQSLKEKENLQETEKEAQIQEQQNSENQMKNENQTQVSNLNKNENKEENQKIDELQKQKNDLDNQSSNLVIQQTLKNIQNKRYSIQENQQQIQHKEDVKNNYPKQTNYYTNNYKYPVFQIKLSKKQIESTQSPICKKKFTYDQQIDDKRNDDEKYRQQQLVKET
ncbi:hypothetical protein PPERSA_06211 [Pseudocohnilembus persalinus]|uniref:Uncharacterized protein n=1 Tax=Pseudocohnilembus persalinus TaxID=266149 RepID=A0A0V0R0Q4_PSEPJ|nr:hypothetical protein PPERSA_06211 [Pseudocohnilembus persalinus]|eukprot:KRX08033.1 hypothetical protein PPERSA_06211 [Pseudocohnilembus persalinus]